MAEDLEVRYPRARAWLETVRAAARRIEPLVREMSALADARDEMLPWQARGAGGGSGAGAHSDPTAQEAERRMVELGRLIEERRQALAACQDHVGACLAVLGRMRVSLGERHATALELYYVDLAPTWSDVAGEMGCGISTIYRMRDKAYGWIEVNCKSNLT